MRTRVLWVGAVCALILVVLSRADADEVTVKGQTLSGKVGGLTPVVIDDDTTLPGLAFDTDYGKGSVLIPFASIEKLNTKDEFHVLYGDDAEAVGRLLGVSEGKLLVGVSTATATPIEVGSIHSIVGKDTYEGSTLAGLKSRYRHWAAVFDAGFSLTEATTDQRSFSAGLRAERRKAPTRFVGSLTSRYGTQSRRGGAKTYTDDLLKGTLKLEYDLTERLFAFAQGDATYDGIQKLSLRAVPETGLGYRLYKSSTAFFQVQSGGAWVYERYFGGNHDSNFSIVFGAEAGAKLPGGAVFSWTADYLPAVKDFAGDYLLRTEAALMVPMYSFLNARFALVDDYDSTPAPDTNHNRFTTTAGIAFVF